MHHHVGRLIAGRYRITEPALPGDDAAGFLATDEQQDTDVTVLARPHVLPEVLTPDDCAHPYGPGADRPRSGAAELSDAVRVVTQLPEHKHLGVVRDVAADGDRVWLVQERITPGEPLSRTLARGPIDPHRAAEIAYGLLRGLRHLHQLGWHHGNITAETIWLDDSGAAILTGLDQAVLDDLVCGIPRHMPQPPTPPPAVTGPGFRTAPRPPSAAPPIPVRPGAVGGIAGGVYADAFRSAVAGPRAAVVRPRPHTAATPPETAARPARPLTPLEAERAQQLRMITVGCVVERWAPEHAVLLSEAAPLPPPVGPPADLWALGALLFRAVTGGPPYPELDDTAELLEMVRCEPPAYAEDTGALRPLIEQLLCPDPLKRPATEELLRWIASLAREAPEPATLTPARAPAPAPGTSLILRFRGHLVRRSRAAMPPSRPVRRRARHRRPRSRLRVPARTIGLITLTAATALTTLTFIVYTSTRPPGPDMPAGDRQLPPPHPSASGPPPDTQPLLRDPAGFSIGVAPGARRHTTPRTVEYRHNGITVTVVPGHDTLRPGETPLDYQKRQPELADVRADPASTASGLRLITIGQGRTIAEGTYRFTPPGGPPTYIRNRVSVLGGRLHLLQVSGPAARDEQVDAAYLQAAESYRLAPLERQPGPAPPERTTPPPGGGRRGRRAVLPRVNDGDSANVHRPRSRTHAGEMAPFPETRQSAHRSTPRPPPDPPPPVTGLRPAAREHRAAPPTAGTPHAHAHRTPSTRQPFQHTDHLLPR
ncbi:hypothetical protein [Streptomyces sp. NPDC057552]|uniref:hypothetical protein n=1 Tax=Streptomyces sp. NPDC057552 TaxID=3350537 RepID=UPI0036BDBAAB